MSTSISHFPEAPWYSYKGGKYSGMMPAYFDPKDFPWIEEQEKGFPIVKAAIEKYLQQQNKSLEPYFLYTHSTRKDSWRGMRFFSWGKRLSACDEIPEAEAFFRSIPGMISASISQLAPQSGIAPHCGDSNTIVRFHMGLRVPAGLPACGIKVRGEEAEWTEGKWLVFCDAHEHSVWNNTDEDRYIFIVDIVHPGLLHQQKNICANGISLNKIQKLDLDHPWATRLPGPVRGAIRHWYKLWAWLSLD
jgi:ornithine lipid ester-linked acyl 2-hydroxylase